MASQGPGCISRLDAYRVVLGVLALVLGATIIYRSLPYPSFGAYFLGACFVAFGLIRIRWFFRRLKERYAKE